LGIINDLWLFKGIHKHLTLNASGERLLLE